MSHTAGSYGCRVSRVAQLAAIAAAVAMVMVGGQVAAAVNGATPISSDPFTNPASQHATEVEPDTFAFGNTVVAAFQVGRFSTGGSTDIGFAVSHNGGHTWPLHGFLPSLTVNATPSGPFARATDPSVAYDAAHRRWLISSLVLDSSLRGVGIATSASTDGGVHWDAPALMTTATGSWDKNWIVCDNSPVSAFYGHCYTTWDDFGNFNLLLSATSTDGGRTWSPPAPTADHAIGIGGQPLVQPDGTVIVAVDDAFESKVLAYRSTDGGASWGPTIAVASIFEHFVAGQLRSSALPSAEIDGAGNVYVVWQDCRFGPGCRANDLVLSRSRDGITWTAPVRIPIDPIASAVDHFIPGLAVDTTTARSSAHLALTYYFYPNAACGAQSCQLNVGFVSSTDGGATWSEPRQLNAFPMSTRWLPVTTQGRMVGDYISTSFTHAAAVAVFALASAPDGGLHESMYAAALNIHRGSLAAHAGKTSAPSGHLRTRISARKL
jgi:hypothetical protein